MASSNPSEDQAETRFGKWARRLGGTLLVALFLIITLYAGGGQLFDFVTGHANRGEFVILYTMSSFFVISYIAYRAFQSPSRLNRLRKEFGLMGIVGTPDKPYWSAQHAGNYLLNITMTTAFATIGLGLFFWPPNTSVNPGGAAPLLDNNTLQAMRFGFLGAYVFSLQLIYRRYTTYDLQPAVYLYCAITIALGLIFNFTAFEALKSIDGSPTTQEVTGIGAGLLAIVAFALGYFPYLAINWFNQVSYRALGVDRRRADQLPLSLLEGISPFHEVRLRDNGIDNVQNLAAADIDHLLINSTFSAQQVIDWVDQAILYLYLDSSTMESFRRAGIRSASDFKDLWNSPEGDRPGQVKAADHLQSTDIRLKTLYTAIQQRPNLHYVLTYWNNASLKEQKAPLKDAVDLANHTVRIERAQHPDDGSASGHSEKRGDHAYHAENGRQARRESAPQTHQ